MMISEIIFLFFVSACYVLLLHVEKTHAQPATRITLDRLLSNAGDIVDIQNAGDERLFIVLQSGSIRIVDIDANGDANIRSGSAFLDISDLVTFSGERGLLGLAFHPNYESNGHFFVNYSDRSSDTVIARYTVSSSNADVADTSSRLVVAEIDQDFSNHNGGQLQFGPDGYLYIAMGDGGRADDPRNRAQDMDSLLGKMLRVDINGMNSGGDLPRWNIPADNPFVNDSNRNTRAIWAYGLRNPWRFSFDSLTNEMWIADVGQREREEVSVQPANSKGGENYGWRICEGTRTNFGNELPNQCSCSDTSCYVPPVFEYTHSGGRCSITGGYVYRGVKYASQLGGTYFFADYCSNDIWGVRPDNNGGYKNFIDQDSGATDITTFGVDQDGELYVAGNERLYRVRPLNGGPGTKTTALPTPSPTMKITTSSPTFTPPVVTIDCPSTYDHSAVLFDGLTLFYSVRVPEDSIGMGTYGGLLCSRLEYNGLGWIGFGVSPNGMMEGAEVVVGKPKDTSGNASPAKYKLASFGNGNMAMSLQSLRDATIEQDASTTVLTYTKLLSEPGEIEIDGNGVNTFIYAVGQGNNFAYHASRGSVTLDFAATLSPTTSPTISPTTMSPTTLAPTTMSPTTMSPTTSPTTMSPKTMSPTTTAPKMSPATMAPTTMSPTTMAPTTMPPTTMAPTTMPPTTMSPTTMSPTTMSPTTMSPTTMAPTFSPVRTNPSLWVVIFVEDFENGFGVFNSRGFDASIRTPSQDSHVINGNSARIRDDSINSVLWTDPFDVSSYNELRVSFLFRSTDVEGREAFFLETSTNGGTSWTNEAVWALEELPSGVNLGYEQVWGVNDQIYQVGESSNCILCENFSPVILGAEGITNIQLRFRCDASTNNDRVYIDDVRFEGRML